MFRMMLLLCVMASGFAEDIEISPESTIQKDQSGKYVVLTDARSKTEYLINLDRIVFIKAANANDNNSFTEIRLGLGEKDNNGLTIKIQQRIIPYDQIRQIILK